jgi:hypothetical protein
MADSPHGSQEELIQLDESSGTDLIDGSISYTATLSPMKVEEEELAVKNVRFAN